MEGGDLRMSSIDSRIVEMQFKNSEFERGIQSSLKSLENLKKGLKLEGATSGLDHLAASTSKFNLGNIASHLQTISSRFTTMGVVGTAALASIAGKAALAGAAMVKSLTLGPLKAGLQEYETNLNSVQTILANTGLEGKKGLGQVNDALGQLNTYSDKTIYNFSQMARNIGTFTAAGVDLKTSTAAIKGIANLAAISGSNAEQASTAMYQLSQAMAAGKATLVDWNSVVNAGMGGKVFQEALKETARVQGVAVDDIIKKNGSFRDSLQEGWLTTEVLTGTLQKFTGDMNAQQLKSLGYTEKQIGAILKMGKTAQDAATKVKTVSQLIGTLQEAAGSGWSKTFQLLFGDFEEARTLFTNVSNVLGGFIQRSADARNKVIGDWKALGGRKVLIDAIAIAFNDLMDVITPIKKAFRDIFPPATGESLFRMTVIFRNLMGQMRLGEDTMDNLRRTFRGIFAVLDIGIQIVKGIATAIITMFKSLKGGSGGLLEFTGNIGDWLVALDQAIKNGEGFKNFFVGLGKVLAAPILFLKIVIGLVKDLVSGADDLGSAGLEKLAERFKPLGALGVGISKAWSGITKILLSVEKVFEPLVGLFSDFFSGLGDSVSKGFADIDYNGVLDGVNTGLLAGLVLLFKKFLAGGINIDLGGGVLGTIKDAFGSLTGVMTAMQTQLKANALLKIAGAIALLTASVVALSLIDSKKLTSALAGLSIMFTQLLIAMGIFEKIVASKGFLKMPFMTASLIALAIAIDLLAVAVSKLSKLDWNELAKGLTGTAVLLGALALFTRFSATNAVSGAGIILLAVGINLLVDAVKDFSDISWENMAKGLTGVAVLLTSLALFTKLSVANAGGIRQGAGLLLLALGIQVLAKAMEDLGQLSWSEIAHGLVAMAGGLAAMAGALALVPPSSLLSATGILIVALSLSKIGDAVAAMGSLKWDVIAKGVTAMAGALTAIALALSLLPPSTLFSAAAIFVVATSLGMISSALGKMGGMTWEQIGKSLVVLAGSLGILAAALNLMTGTLAGSAALLIAAAALGMLAPVLLAFGQMSLGEIAKSLITLAGVFVVLGAAGLLLAPLTPILLALGISIGLLGAGMLAAGGGMFLFGLGLTAVAAAGGAAVGVLVGAVRAILNLIPEILGQLGDIVAAFANAIKKAAPAVTSAIVVVLTSLLNAIIRLTPKIVQTLGVLLSSMLRAMVKYVPMMADAGLRIMLAILQALAAKMPQLVKAGTDVAVNFINGVAANLPRIIQAGTNLIISFINGVADAIRNNSSAMGEAGANLGSAIIEGMARGLAGGVGVIANKAKDVASSALNAAKDVLGIHSPSREFELLGKYVIQGFLKGLDGNKSQIDSAFVDLKKQIADLQKDELSRLASLQAKLKKMEAPGVLRNPTEINKVKAAIAQTIAEINRLHFAYITTNKHLKDEQVQLGKLANKYDQYTRKIDAAKESLANAIKTRDDYNRSVREQYANLATPEDDQSVTDFIAAGKKQVQDTIKFANILQKLKARGLNAEMYKDLLDKGLTALPFAEQLLAGGKAAISQVNKIETDLNKVGAGLGATASKTLYQAGVDAAAGLVKGLQKQQANLEKVMDALAARMVAAIKKSLHIKSPSRVMAEIGQYSVEGMAYGLEKYSGLVADSAKKVGDDAVESLRKSMSGISDILITDPEFKPIIRPVLDLTDVKKNATAISGMMKTLPINVAATSAKAADISVAVQAIKLAQRMADFESEAAAAVSFTQINNSPKTLSNAEIYRQTKNQLSIAKGALT